MGERHDGLAALAAQNDARLFLRRIQCRDTLQRIAFVRSRRRHRQCVAAHPGISVQQPPLAIAAIGLHRGIAQVAVNIPISDVSIDLHVLDRGDPLDHLPRHRRVVIIGVFVDVDRQVPPLVRRACEDLILPVPVQADARPHRRRIAQFVPRHDIGQRSGGNGVAHETEIFGEKPAGIGPRDPRARQRCTDHPHRPIPRLKKNRGISLPSFTIAAFRAAAEHVSFRLVERHEDDAVTVFRCERLNLFDLLPQRLDIVRHRRRAVAGLPAIGEVPHDVGHVDIGVAAGGIGQQPRHVQSIRTRMLRSVLCFGRHRAQPDPLDEVREGQPVVI